MMTNEELTSHVMALEERATRHTEQIKTAFNQISDVRKLAESVHELATSVKLLSQGQTTISTKVDKLSRELDEIKDKPAKRWESVVGVVVTVVVTALVTYLLTQAGMK